MRTQTYPKWLRAQMYRMLFTHLDSALAPLSLGILTVPRPNLGTSAAFTTKKRLLEHNSWTVVVEKQRSFSCPSHSYEIYGFIAFTTNSSKNIIDHITVAFTTKK